MRPSFLSEYPRWTQNFALNLTSHQHQRFCYNLVVCHESWFNFMMETSFLFCLSRRCLNKWIHEKRSFLDYEKHCKYSLWKQFKNSLWIVHLFIFLRVCYFVHCKWSFDCDPKSRYLFLRSCDDISGSTVRISEHNWVWSKRVETEQETCVSL